MTHLLDIITLNPNSVTADFTNSGFLKAEPVIMAENATKYPKKRMYLSQCK
jgi:hypothetical protein